MVAAHAYDLRAVKAVYVLNLLLIVFVLLNLRMVQGNEDGVHPTHNGGFRREYGPGLPGCRFVYRWHGRNGHLRIEQIGRSSRAVKNLLFFGFLNLIPGASTAVIFILIRNLT